MNKSQIGFKVLFISVCVIAFTNASYATQSICNLEKAKEFYSDKKITDAESILQNCIKQKTKLEETEKIADSYFYLGLIERGRKNLSSSQENFRNAIAISPKSFFRLEYGVSLEWDQKLDLALEQYDLLLTKEVNNKFALHGKARVLRWLRRLDESDSIYKLLLAKDVNDINAKTGRGFILLMDKNYKHARKIFSDVLAIDPNNNEAKLGLKQLEGLKKHVFTHSIQTKRKNSETIFNQQATKHELQVRSEFNNKWTGLFGFSKQNDPLDGLDLTRDGLSINREAEYKVSAYSLYDGLKKKYLAGVDVKKTFNKEYEYQLTLQTEGALKNKQRWYAGIRPTIIKSKVENTLLYGGHFKPITPKLDLQSQLFYVIDPKQKNSSALVSTLMYRPNKKLSGSFGVSLSDNNNGLEKVLHSAISYQRNDKLNLGLNYVKKLDVSSSEISFRINYRY